MPTAAETRKSRLMGPLENTITPLRFQVPPRPPVASHNVCVPGEMEMDLGGIMYTDRAVPVRDGPKVMR